MFLAEGFIFATTCPGVIGQDTNIDCFTAAESHYGSFKIFDFLGTAYF